MKMLFSHSTKYRIYAILGILIAITITGCGSESPTYKTPKRISKPIHLKVEEPQERTYSDSLYSELEFLTLKGFEQGLIGHINKVIVNDEKIFALDRDYSKSIYAFDKSGNHLFTIGKKGGGPGEFTVIEDFDIHADSILIYDSGNGRISIFDMDGKFKSQGPKLSRIGVIPDAISFKDNKIYSYSQASCGDFGCYTLTVTDLNNELIHADVPNNHLKSFFVDFGKNQFRHKENIYLAQIFNDTLYQIGKDDSMLTPFVLDYERSSQELETINKAVKDRREGLGKLLKARVNIGTVKVYANDSHIWLQNLDDNKLKNIIISISEKQAFSFKNVLFDAERTIPFSDIVGSDNERFIFYVGNEQLLSLKNSENSALKDSEKLDMVNEETNGLLVFAKILLNNE